MVERDEQPRRGDAGAGTPRPPGPRRAFLSVWFRCCHVYGRIYRNAERTEYNGRCPRCGAPVRALIGADGTDHRIFMTD
ncbi:MAG: hypothetical protein ACYS15_18245 [Planctomycetota bacterium]|jgi:hypothetical protein